MSLNSEPASRATFSHNGVFGPHSSLSPRKRHPMVALSPERHLLQRVIRLPGGKHAHQGCQAGLDGRAPDPLECRDRVVQQQQQQQQDVFPLCFGLAVAVIGEDVRAGAYAVDWESKTRAVGVSFVSGLVPFSPKSGLAPALGKAGCVDAMVSPH